MRPPSTTTIEYHGRVDERGRCSFTLGRLRDYHPGHPMGENRIGKRYQSFFADPRTHGHPLPPGSDKVKSIRSLRGVDEMKTAPGSDLHYLQEPYELIDRPLWWHERGLSQTASGYGSKLASRRCARLPDGRVRRIYVTCWSNSGTAWVTLDGKRQVIR